MSDLLRSALLKKRTGPVPPAKQDDSAAGAGAAGAAAAGAPESEEDKAKYGKLKLSTTAQMKQGGRQYYDSADRKTLGLSAPSTASQNAGAPSSHATTTSSSSGLRKGDGPVNKNLMRVANPSAVAGSAAMVDEADSKAAQPSPPAASTPQKDDGPAPGPGVSAPAPAEARDSDDKEEPSAKRVGTVPTAGANPASPPAAGAAGATGATGQVHIVSGAGGAGGAGHPKVPADILLVEDVRVSQRIAQVALQKARFKVDVASTAEQAVEMFQSSGPYKIVLMDIQLPKMNGMEATQIIRDFETAALGGAPPAQAGPDGITPGRSLIFGLTGAVEEENLRQYRAVGMNGCIAKGKLLATAVKSAMEKIAQNPAEFVNLVSM